MTILTAVMFVVYAAFTILLMSNKKLAKTLTEDLDFQGDGNSFLYRLLGGLGLFPIYALLLSGVGWVAWKVGCLMLLPFKYLYSLFPFLST